MMIRGLEFNCSRKNENILSDILSGIDIKMYDWYVVQDEIYCDDRYVNMPTCFHGAELTHNMPEISWINFLNMCAYPVNSETVDILTFNDFSKSNCELILLITDVTSVEIYVKSRTLLRLLAANAYHEMYTDLEIKTDYNDLRTIMRV